MPLKTMTMTVTSGWPDRNSERMDFYRVEQVTDSIQPRPGVLIHESEVEQYCANSRWKVTIKPNPSRMR